MLSCCILIIITAHLSASGLAQQKVEFTDLCSVSLISNGQHMVTFGVTFTPGAMWFKEGESGDLCVLTVVIFVIQREVAMKSASI